MQAKDLRTLLLLAAIWGCSFPFMTLAAPDFGPVALAETRVLLSAVFLLPLCFIQHKTADLKTHWFRIGICGLFNIAIPFLLFCYAALSVTAGMLAVINALTPLFGALVARLWLGEYITRLRMLGLFMGFSGIAFLVAPDLSFHAGGLGWPILAATAAPFSYAVAASYMTRYLRGVDSMAIASGSITAAAVVLLPLAVWTWPYQPISLTGWSAATGLAILCTGLAYLIFYRLISAIGASRTITVTFLVPIFGIAWSVILTGETLSLRLIGGAVIVLCGTLLATGFISAKPKRK